MLRALRGTVLWERRDRGGGGCSEQSQDLEMGVSRREERAHCRQGELNFLSSVLTACHYELAQGHKGQQDRQGSCSPGTCCLRRCGQLTTRYCGLRD